MSITVNMTKARNIHREYIRLAREKLLPDLDVQFQRALETSADTASIVSKKQALRDAPADSAIESAADVTALKAQWNTSILGPSPY